LALLYLVVFAIVKKAQNRLLAQSRERQQAQQALALSEERWKFALEGSGDGVWDRDLVTDTVVLSNRYKEIYGFSDDELQDRSEDWTARVHPNDLPQVVAERDAYLSGQTSSYASERRMQCKDGSWKWILSRGMVVARDAQGKPLRLIGTHSDVTERHLREQELQLAATVMQTMDEAVIVTDARNQIISVNPAFTSITGYPPDQVTGKNPNLLASGEHPAGFYQAMWQHITSAGSWQGEIRNRHSNGKAYTEWLSIKKIVNQQGAVTNYVAVFSNITERKAHEAHLQQLAHFDSLTELPNRALLADRLHQAIARARRDKTRLALMFMDLDKFKPVNDELGHAVGDLLLKAVAERLRQCVQRLSDTVARVGGDEFVVLLQDIGDPSDVMALALKIRAALEQPFELGGHTIRVSVSIGIALFPQHGGDEKSLLKNADIAMYQSKDSGRNRVQLFDGNPGTI
jgi:diguanylate cyclase (GGDEF)-like protein/PAS domain S-box-containing protein